MRAMVLEKTAAIEHAPLLFVDDYVTPSAGRGEVRLRVHCCAVCRTDLHIVEGDLPQVRRPLIPGHQIVGTVDALGEGCKRLTEGQKVGAAWLGYTCGRCAFCRSGRENLCEQSRYTGYHDDGGYGEFVVVREDYAYEIPEVFDDLAAAPLLCAGIIGFRALERASVPPGGTLLMVGFGSSAHIVIPIALYRGHEVFVVTRSHGHQQLAQRMGATWVGSDPRDLPSKPEGAIVFAPVGALVGPVLEAMQRGGRVALAGIHMSAIPELDYEKHLYYEREVRSVTANTREDGERLLVEAAAAGVRPQVFPYPLKEANRALSDMKHSRIDGTGVLVPS